MLFEAPLECISKVYFSESWFDAHAEELLLKYGIEADSASSAHFEASAPFEYEVMQDNIFRAVSDTENPQGVLLIVRRQEASLDELLDAEAPLLVFLESLQDPGNLGTIFRTAEGAGATGIIIGGNCVDLYNPKTVRSTMGSIYRVPFCKAPETRAALSKIHAAGITSYAAHLHAEYCYDEADYTKGTVFIIGNESAGISDALSSASDRLIKIPMEGRLESLNASIAAALLMYEAQRQRRNMHR